MSTADDPLAKGTERTLSRNLQLFMVRLVITCSPLVFKIRFEHGEQLFFEKRGIFREEHLGTGPKVVCEMQIALLAQCAG